MARVRIACDSTADLEAGFRRDHDVRVVPLKVIFGDAVFEDGETITPAEFYTRMRESSVQPRTSQPTPGEFEAVFRELTDDGCEVVCTTISARLSGTYASATQAQTALGDRAIRVIDTENVAIGHTAAVLAAVRAAEAGGDADAVEAAVREVMQTQHVVFTVETLEYLRRGGRIGGARALLGSMLNVKPILVIEDGAIEPRDRVRTFQRALDHIVGEVVQAAKGAAGVEVFIAHGDRPEVAADLAERIAPLAGVGEVRVSEVGAVIGCHAGPGVIGVGYRTLHPAEASARI